MRDKEKSIKEKKIKQKISRKFNIEAVLDILGPVVFAWFLWLFFYLCFIPVFYNFHEATVVGKVFMIIGSVAFVSLFVLLIWGLEKVKVNSKKKLYSRCTHVVVFILFVISLLHYFNYTLWGYNYTVWGFVLVGFFLFGFYLIAKFCFGWALNSEVKPILLMSLGLLSLFIAWVNYDANIPVSAIYLKIAVGFFYLIAVALYVFYVFCKGSFKKVSISRIISAVFWASLILISFPFYVQWCGLKGCDFQTFVSIYSAVVGGGLTLAGVAWTIQHTNKIRQDDRKNENKPFMGLLNNLSVEVKEANQHVYHFSPSANISGNKSIIGNFVNSDKNCFILKKISIGETDYAPDSQYFISKGEIFQIKIFEDEIPNDECKIVLIVEDQNGNEWLYSLVKNGIQIMFMNAIEGENK